MKRFIIVALCAVLALTAVSVHAETREEMKDRLRVISQWCIEHPGYDFSADARRTNDCLRIGSLRDDLIRCASERNRLRIAAGCSHRWEDIGPGTRWCRECRSIAHFLGGKWQVTFTGGMWVGADPLQYPEEYGLKRDAAACSHHWVDSAKGMKFCERCGIYAIQHINGDWMTVPSGGKWIGAEPK